MPSVNLDDITFTDGSTEVVYYNQMDSDWCNVAYVKTQTIGVAGCEPTALAIMEPGHFTTARHFIVLRGVTAEGKLLVADPVSYGKSQQEWDASIVLNEASKNTAANGPFWVIG